MSEVAEVPEDVQESSQPRLRESENNELEPRAVGTIYKVAIGVQTDNNLPRDNIWVTPHFRDTAGTQSPADLALMLANQMPTYLGAPHRGQVKVYLEDFNPAAVHNPLATVDFGTVGTFCTSSGPREIALCLSYYSLQNSKRFRGRLYIPHAWIRVAGGGSSAAPAVRPTAQMMGTALSFATSVLHAPYASGNIWCVASTVDKVARVVSDYWVDDEWDVQRRRGFRGTTRQTGTFP